MTALTTTEFDTIVCKNKFLWNVVSLLLNVLVMLTFWCQQFKSDFKGKSWGIHISSSEEFNAEGLIDIRRTWFNVKWCEVTLLEHRNAPLYAWTHVHVNKVHTFEIKVLKFRENIKQDSHWYLLTLPSCTLSLLATNTTKSSQLFRNEILQHSESKHVNNILILYNR